MGAALADEVRPLEAGSKTMIVSLLYHDVVEPGAFSTSGFEGGDADVYKLEHLHFEQHLRAIEGSAAAGPVAVLDSASRELPPRALLLTFDDGGASALSIASMLESRGWRGHFFITTDYIGRSAFLTAEQARELHRRGHIIGSHSCSHPVRMSYCTRPQLVREWKSSLQVLAEILGEKPRVASVPGGYYSPAVAESASAAGIEVLFNSEPTTRIYKVDGCLVVGRYSIQQGVSAQRAAALARGDTLPRFRQYLYWNSKRIAKRLGGNFYISLRKALLKNSA